MYKFVNRDEGSSVYSAVAKVLLGRPNNEWKKVQRDTERFHVMFGERNKLPFARLGHESGIVQAVNYYRGSSVICRKVPLVRTVRTFCSKAGQDPYLWMPVTFIILPSPATKSKSDRRTTVYEDERKQFREHYTGTLTEHGQSVWIAKSTSGAKGQNILISNDIEDILCYVDQQSEAYTVQKYVEDPLLLQGGRKFDVRCWVLLDHRYNIYVFSEGVLRTSSETYVSSDFDNITSHLTNHCIQEVHSPNFGKYEDGNEMFFDEFARYLKQKHGINFKEKILPQIHTIIVNCLLGIKEQITTAGLSYHSFQLFGFDFLIDTMYKVWLIEVNGAPACASRLLSDLAHELVRTAIDPIFPPSLECNSTEETCPRPTGKGYFQLISECSQGDHT